MISGISLIPKILWLTIFHRYIFLHLTPKTPFSVFCETSPYHLVYPRGYWEIIFIYDSYIALPRLFSGQEKLSTNGQELSVPASLPLWWDNSSPWGSPNSTVLSLWLTYQFLTYFPSHSSTPIPCLGITNKLNCSCPNASLRSLSGGT